MRSKLIAVFFAVMLLAGCSAPKEVTPVVETPDPSALLAKPPAAAMVPAHKPLALKKGDTLAGNSVIMRKNNLLCVDDRTKLTTLQQYILGIFPAQK